MRLKAYASPCNAKVSPAPVITNLAVIWDHEMSFNHKASLSNTEGSIYMIC